MRYPEAVNLPFNRDILGEGFELSPEECGDEPGFWVVLQGGALVVRDMESGGALPEGPLFEGDKIHHGPVTIGRWQGKPLRVVVLDRTASLPEPYVAEPFNAVEERLDDRIMTLGGIGQQVIHWQRQSAFCSRCGAPTRALSGSWGKLCSSCNHEHFPHIHPCAIVLVRRGDEFLLTRKPGWIEGRYGLVAGFLDLGESLEECARREVMEETGIAVTNVRYVGSQNWPFPSQLMAGFTADYAGGEIRVDRTELEDARWFCSASLPVLPPRRSIARWIIDHYAGDLACTLIEDRHGRKER
ncbi:MAG TPA: NAD(+) diphosphatase [Geobacteraceae bacterium]